MVEVDRGAPERDRSGRNEFGQIKKGRKEERQTGMTDKEMVGPTGCMTSRKC